MGFSRTSAIERPYPYGDLYFIRSHDFCTPATAKARTLSYPVSPLPERTPPLDDAVYVHDYVGLSHDTHVTATLFSTHTANLSFSQTTLRLTVPPVTHFAILLKARRAPDKTTAVRPFYRGYRVRLCFRGSPLGSLARFDRRARRHARGIAGLAVATCCGGERKRVDRVCGRSFIDREVICRQCWVSTLSSLYDGE